MVNMFLCTIHKLWRKFPGCSHDFFTLFHLSAMKGIIKNQFSSVAQSYLTLSDPWTAAHQASLSITNSQSLLKLMSTELVIPANHLILCHSLPLLPSVFPSMRVFSSELVLCIRWPKCWCFSFSISPSSEYSGLIYFRVVWLDLLAVSKGLSRVLPNTTVQKHQFFNTQLYLWSSFHIHT